MKKTEKFDKIDVITFEYNSYDDVINKGEHDFNIIQVKMKVGFISLGCSKNLVDTEMMIGLFKKKGHEIVNNPKEAEVIVINTCGFINSAKEEAINTILEMAEYKNQNCKYLIVTGCLIERYKDELIKEIPEVDLFIKFSEYETFWSQIEELIAKKEIKKLESLNKEKSTNKENKSNSLEILDEDKGNKFSNDMIDECKENKSGKDMLDNLDFLDRIISTGCNYAYIRIAEGCNNFCTFCAIPYIRGRYASRKEDDILEEVKNLANQGIREFIIIAQDTTKYGIDIYGKPMLADLLHKISQIQGVEWIRFLYSYPETITDDLIQEVKTNKKICKYFDIPMQHISDKILKKMNRKSTEQGIKKLILRLRKEIPDVIIRSTLMVGFPGETEEDFAKLYDFVNWAKFDKLGCFTYSKEEGTAAATMPEQVHPSTKKSRYNKIMKLQEEISKENLKRFIGGTYQVLIEDAVVADDNSTYFVGRTYMDVPEIDGNIYLKGDAEINTFVKCKVTDVSENYDLIGEIITK